MREILKTPITDRSAWCAEDVEQDLSWLYILKQAEQDEVRAAVARVKERRAKLFEFGPEDFPLPRLAARLVQIRKDVEGDRGFAVLRGLPMEELDRAAAKLMYWGLAMHFGTPITQNARGELIAEVADLGFDRTAANVRGYTTKARAMPHCDSCDVASLLCYHPAMEGGESAVASSMAIYNDILANHPEYLETLCQGFHYDLRGEGVTGDLNEVTFNRIPVFSYYAEKLSCRYNGTSILRGAIKTGEELTGLQTEALDYVRQLALRPENCFRFTMRRGDWQLVNNHLVLHARTAFVDDPDDERRRRLFRVWFNVPNGRPLAPEFADRCNTGPRGGVHVREAAGYWSGSPDALKGKAMPV